VFQHTKKGFRVRIIYLRISPDKMRKNKTANVKLRIKKHFFANMLTKHLKTAQIVIVWTSSSFSLLIRTFCDLPKLSLRFHFHKKKKKIWIIIITILQEIHFVPLSSLTQFVFNLFPLQIIPQISISWSFNFLKYFREFIVQ
jgi:hypothetical protein